MTNDTIIRDIIKKVIEISTEEKIQEHANDITRLSAPVNIYDYVHLNKTGNGISMTIFMECINTSGDDLSFSATAADTFQSWFSFKDNEGNVLAKPGQNTAFDSETVQIVKSPAGETVADGEKFEYAVRFSNITYELTNDQLADAEFWALGFRLNINALGIRNAYDVSLVEDLTMVAYFHV